jgi:hypothetical protein
MKTGDKYGNGDFDVVPFGPRKGGRWVEVPTLTLHAILSAVEKGAVVLDERRVAAIKEGLRAKDERGSRVNGDR